MAIYMRLARLRERTIQAYTGNVRNAMEKIGKEPHDFSESDIMEYLNGLYERGASGPTIINHFSALKYLFLNVLKIHWPVQRIARLGKFGLNKPRPLSRKEIKKLLDATSNLKYKTIFTIAYSAGLRVCEVCYLKISDLDFSENIIYVRNGKGGQSRLSALSRKAARLIKTYIEQYQVTDWLFAAGKKQCSADLLFAMPVKYKPISIRSVEREFRITADKLQLAGYTTLHSLRHSFGTHLIEDGLSIFSIQKMMGHKNIRTTLAYLKTAATPVHKYFSPFDNF